METTKRLVLLSFDDPAIFPWGGEPILMDGANVGEITSAGYSRRHGRALAMGYARTEHPLTDAAVLAGRWRADVAGDEVAVTPHPTAF